MNVAPTFPIDDFLAEFPVFADKDVIKVQGAGRRAMHYIKNAVHGMPLPMDDGDRWYALFLLTAHIVYMDENMDDSEGNPGGAGGGGAQTMGRVKKATVGAVAVETDSPNTYTSTALDYWLNQSPYGQELLAFLDSVSAVGVFLNGRPDSVRVLH